MAVTPPLDLQRNLNLCRHRVLRAEKLIDEFLVAHDASEMENEQQAIERLRKFRGEV